MFAGKTLIKEVNIADEKSDNKKEIYKKPSMSINGELNPCPCAAKDGGCFNELDWFIKFSISVDGENIWYDLKPNTKPVRGTEILTGVIDLPEYILDQSPDGNVQFKFTQNTKQCTCCDDLFIRLVKPMNDAPSKSDVDNMKEEKDFQFISYDGFY